MTSIVKQFQYPELSRTSNGGRKYIVGEKRLPSVTTILDACTDKTWLIEWKKRVGESEAKRISTESSNIGTLVHSCLEHHIQKTQASKKNNLVYQLASKMANAIIVNGLKHIPVVWGVEAKLYYEDLYAGTTDLVGLWKNKPAIIDFKTTKNKKSKKDIQNYFLQGVAYAHAHNQMFDTNIETVVILMVDRDANYSCFETEPGEFERYGDIWNNYLCQYYKLNIDA